jgi:hypothetical protein
VKRARLVLARETLSRLSPDDLAEINGASISHMTCLTPWSGVTFCRTCDVEITGLCNSFVGCPSSPCTKQD